MKTIVTHQNTASGPGLLEKPLPGWHRKPGARPPHKDKSTTMDPIRSRRDIGAIKEKLSTNPRDASLFLTGIHVGLRGSDLLGLKWQDVSGPDGKILSRVAITEKKTGKLRVCAIQPHVQRSLELWRAYRVPRSEYVWPGRDGTMTVQRLNQMVKGWCKAVSLVGKFGSHTLRKTYGYHLRKAGHDIDLLMKIFGHSSAAITLRYIGIQEDEIHEANLKLVL